MLTFSYAGRYTYFAPIAGVVISNFSVYCSTNLSGVSCVKLLLLPHHVIFFFCFTLQVIVILELCSNQPHEASGIDLGAGRILALTEFYAPNKKQIYAATQRNPLGSNVVEAWNSGQLSGCRRRCDLSLDTETADSSA